MKMEHIERSETSAYKIQMPGNHPEENIQHTEHGESLKSKRTLHVSDSFSVHHQEFFTVHTAIGICHTGFAGCMLAGSGCSILIPLACSQHNLYDIPIAVCTVLDS
jgi:hypothetical protein